MSGRVALAAVTDAVLDASTVEEAVLSDRDGALVTFRGVIRDHDAGRDVTRLDYSAHPDAQRFLAEVCARIAERTGLTVAAAHRIGGLTVGDVALVAAVAAPHRVEAFQACGDLVDAIKAEVPIWKRQYFPRGSSEWVGL